MGNNYDDFEESEPVRKNVDYTYEYELLTGSYVEDSWLASYLKVMNKGEWGYLTEAALSEGGHK